MKNNNIFLCLLALVSIGGWAQDKGVFKPVPNNYYQQILRDVNAYEATQQPAAPNSILAIDHSKATYPKDPAAYKSVWHNKPISQGLTSTCWCFATLSFYESEVKRITGKEVKLSEMYVVYWEYVERAKYFVQTRGNMFFGEGSETNAVAKIMHLYGIVPYSDYTGKPEGQKFYNHDAMFMEIEGYLAHVKQNHVWNENEVVKTVKSILEFYMGRVPNQVIAEGRTMSPYEYFSDYLKLHSDNYVNLMSLVKYPYGQKTLYDVPDNWWRSDDYYNLPLTDFMKVVKTAIANGYSVSLGGDVSEVGFDKEEQVAIVPDFDIPSSHINEFARQMRFENESTTDDHAMHIVGFQEVGGKTWYLLKDSGSGSRNCGEQCKSFGYYFMHEDYVKLKMMTATVHRNVLGLAKVNLK
jgi:bleomycin hydrolase